MYAGIYFNRQTETVWLLFSINSKLQFNTAISARYIKLFKNKEIKNKLNKMNQNIFCPIQILLMKQLIPHPNYHHHHLILK